MKKRSVGNTVLVVDGGGRSAALVDSYARSEHVERVIAVPGNDLMSFTQDDTGKEVKTYSKYNGRAIKTTSIGEILEICEREGVNLVDVAQDNAVQVGLVDEFIKRDIAVVGPTKDAGQIEWDKAFARELGEQYGLSQPFFKICFSPQEGLAFLRSQPNQSWFVKAAYLAEGKGALPAQNNEEAMERVREMARFKEAGQVFLIEKWLRGDNDEPGEEFSTFIFSDGRHYKIIGSAQDHKRVGNFDEGENTGGMGCSAPPLVLTPEIMQDVEMTIFNRVLAGLSAEGRPYKGVLYLGGMVIKQKGKLKPYVVEFNARWGDPEAQVILPGLMDDLFEVGMAITQGDISGLKIQNDGKTRVVVAGVSRGYPGNYEAVKGKEVYGLNEARKVDGVKIYGAGVKAVDNKHYANGGRLFYVVGEGENVIEARQKAYEAMAMVYIEGNNLHYRIDIGWRDVERLCQTA